MKAWFQGLSGAAHVATLLILAATDCDILLLPTENYEACFKCFPMEIRRKLALNYKKIMRGEKFPNARKVKRHPAESCGAKARCPNRGQ